MAITVPTTTVDSVSGIQNRSISLTNEVLIDANTFIADLRALQEIESIVIDGLPDGNFSTDATQGALGLLSQFAPLPPTLAAYPGLVLPPPPLVAFSEVAEVAIPEFTATSPVLEIPAVPTTALPTAPTAPTVVEVDIPVAPVVTFPAVPTFTPVTLPDIPAVDIPSFLATLPSEDFTAPTNSFSWYEEAYESALLDASRAKLLEDIQNGGYGIEPDDEDALWERMREREVESAQVAVEEILRVNAARGFALTPGEVTVALQRAHQDLQNKMSAANRDIALKRADMYVENRKFTITEIRSMEQILIGLHTSVQERALNAAKATIDVAIALFEAQLKRHNSRLDAYRAEATVYEARIRAALAQAEIYKTTMEGKRLEVDVQRAAVDLYRAQLSGIESVINVYKVQMEGAGLRANIERTKIDAFRSLIDAYTSQVQARTSEFGAYEAQIRGEVAKSQAFESQARAYSAQVDGLKIRADIRLGNLRSEIEAARVRSENYRAEISGAELNLRQQSEIADTATKRYGIDVQAFGARMTAIAEAYRLQQAAERNTADRMFKSADVATNNARLAFEGLQEVLKVKLTTHDIAKGYYTSLLSGLVQAVQGISTKSATSTT